MLRRELFLSVKHVVVVHRICRRSPALARDMFGHRFDGHAVEMDCDIMVYRLVAEGAKSR